MTIATPPHVLIVGAGPTGLTAAVELARRGLVPTVIDRRSGPSRLSRAVGIFEPTLHLLAPSGADAAIRAEAIRFRGIAFHSHARRVATFPLNFDDRSRIWGLPQDRTEHHLAEALSRHGGRIAFDCPFEGLTQDDAGVTVDLGGREARFDLVLGADGSHSTVRQTLGIPFDGYDLPGDWSIADADSASWRDPDMFQGFMLDGGHIAVVVPLERQRFRIISSLPDAIAALPVRFGVETLHRQDTFTIAVRQVAHYSHGRVHLAGDAAHCHSPVGGRGMNIGIADGADFAARLLSGTLDGYSCARHAIGHRIIGTTERARRVLQSTNPVVRSLALATMATVSRVPPLARAAMRRAASF